MFLCPCYCNIQEQLILLTVPLLVFMSSKLAWEKITVLNSNCLVMLPSEEMDAQHKPAMEQQLFKRSCVPSSSTGVREPSWRLIE